MVLRVINSFSNSDDYAGSSLKIDIEHNKIVKEINENSNIQMITANKNDQDILC